MSIEGLTKDDLQPLQTGKNMEVKGKDEAIPALKKDDFSNITQTKSLTTGSSEATESSTSTATREIAFWWALGDTQKTSKILLLMIDSIRKNSHLNIEAITHDRISQ